MKVQVSHLQDGHHTLELSEPVDTYDLEKIARFIGKINAVIELDKRSSDYYASVRMDANAEFECNRCLESFEKSLQEKIRLVFTSDEKLLGSDDDDIRQIASNQFELDFTDDIRDALSLSIPSKLLCTEECKGLCSRCGKNLNEGDCDCENDEIDPRWEALSKLFSKN